MKDVVLHRGTATAAAVALRPLDARVAYKRRGSRPSLGAGLRSANARALDREMPAPDHELVLGVGLPLHLDRVTAGGKRAARALDLMTLERVAVAAVRTARGHIEGTGVRRLGLDSADEDAHEAAVIVGIEAAALGRGGEARHDESTLPRRHPDARCGAGDVDERARAGLLQAVVADDIHRRDR